MNEHFWEGFQKEALQGPPKGWGQALENVVNGVAGGIWGAGKAVKNVAMANPTTALISGTALGAGIMHIDQKLKERDRMRQQMMYHPGY